MKTLNEQIADIMKADMTSRKKSNALIKLGLTKRDVQNLLSIKAVLPGDFDFSKITFGVEIEAYNFTRRSLIDAANALGLEVRSEDYNHHTRPTYKIVSDASLTGANSNEVVSPILNGNNGLQSLETLCRALAAVNAKVNRSCGLHIHIGAASMTDQHYVRIFKNYRAIERAIDKFMPISRRGNNGHFCQSLQNLDFSGCNSKRDVFDMMPSRYFKVNSHSYTHHQTVEFRQHSGTVDYTKISKWVMFLAKLVEYSFKHDCPICSTIEDIPFLTDDEKRYFISRRDALN